MRGIPIGRAVRGSTIGSRWEWEWEGESVGEGGVALSVFLHPFCLFCIVSQLFRGCYRTLLPLSGVSQAAQCFYM